MKDFEIPEGLCPKGKKAAEAIVRMVELDAQRVGRAPYTGGCRAFYSPKEWEEKGNQYGQGALLIVVHDGGDLAPFFNQDYGDWVRFDRQTRTILRVGGVYTQSCTSWHSAIYEG